MAGTLNLSIDQGSTFSRTIRIMDGETPSAAVDLTGQTFRGQIRKYATDATAVATFTCTVLDQGTNTGEMTFSLTAAQTAAIVLKAQKTALRTAIDYSYDIERVLVSGAVERLLEGVVSVSPEVTRA